MTARPRAPWANAGRPAVARVFVSIFVGEVILLEGRRVLPDAAADALLDAASILLGAL